MTPAIVSNIADAGKAYFTPTATAKNGTTINAGPKPVNPFRKYATEVIAIRSKMALISIAMGRCEVREFSTACLAFCKY